MIDRLNSLSWVGEPISLEEAEQAVIELMLPDEAARVAGYRLLATALDTSMSRAATQAVLLTAFERPSEQAAKLAVLATQQGHALSYLKADLRRFAIQGSPAALVALAALDRDAILPWFGPQPPPNRALALWCYLQHPEAVSVTSPSELERLILAMNTARLEPTFADDAHRLESQAAGALYPLFRLVEPGIGVFDDPAARTASLPPAARWAMLSGFIADGWDPVRVDVLTSRLVDTFLPNKVAGFEDLPYEARVLIGKALKSAWSDSPMQRKLRAMGLPYSFKAVSQAFEKYGVVETVTFLPEMYPEAVAAVEREGVPLWRGAPFVFFGGDTSLLDTQIPEDPEWFPKTVMDASGRIAAYFHAAYVKPNFPTLTQYRFYAIHSAQTLMDLARRNGWRVQEGPGPRRVGHRVTDRLEKSGWQDARAWEEPTGPRWFAARETESGKVWISGDDLGAIVTLASGSITDALVIRLCAPPDAWLEDVACLEPGVGGLKTMMARLVSRGIDVRFRISPRTDLQI